MSTLSFILIGLVALLHFGFMILEMVLWDKPIGLKIFRNSADKAQITKTLALNQGLYNGFLVAGLAWSLLINNETNAIFFLCCVVVAGIVGAMSVSRTIIYVQALPAILALGSLLL